MKKRIKKGRHRSFPPSVGIYYNKKEIARKVIFHESCLYDTSGGYGHTNKLFGIGYFMHHHTDSARFGWRPNLAARTIELVAYVYDGGKIDFNNLPLVAVVPVEQELNLSILIQESRYMFVVDTFKSYKEIPVPKSHNKKWGYKLGFFFGGETQTAPHDVIAEIIKIK